MGVIFNAPLYEDRLKLLKVDLQNKYDDLLKYQPVNFAEAILEDDYKPYEEDPEDTISYTDTLLEFPCIDMHVDKNFNVKDMYVLSIDKSGIYAMAEEGSPQFLRFSDIVSIEGKIYLLTEWENHLK